MMARQRWTDKSVLGKNHSSMWPGANSDPVDKSCAAAAGSNGCQRYRYLFAARIDYQLASLLNGR
jgi:hypothetical protein